MSRTLRRGDGYIEVRTRKDGSHSYLARWHDGTAWRGRTFRDEDSAEDHLRGIGRTKRRGDYTPESTMRVDEALAAYIERGARRWRSNTVATYSLLAKQQIIPHLGRRRLTALTPAIVQTWLDELAGSGLSAAVVENARTVLSGACKEAVKLGMLTTNPVTGTTPPARTRRTHTTWSAHEVARVYDALRDDVRMLAYYRVALTTAMRPGELRALRWDDIDMEAGVITVQRTMTRDAGYHHVMGTTTKTGKTRAIGVPASTIAALRAHRQDQRTRQIAAEHWKDVGIVFDRGDGNPMAQQSVATFHRRIAETAGVTRIRMHDTRHTAATLMLQNNVHPKIVADILGHSSVATTLDIYSHADVSMQRQATDGLAEAIERARKA